MKKLFSFTMIVFCILTLVACGKDVITWAGVEDKTIEVGTEFDPRAGVTATDTEAGNVTASISVSGAVNTNTAGSYKITYKVTGSDGKEYSRERVITVQEGSGPGRTTITIMHGAPYEVDPKHPQYSGRDAQEKRQLQDAVEAKYNITVRYVAYSQADSWGDPRVNGIINASIEGKPKADIYLVSNDWISRLVKGKAILPIDEWLPTFGPNINPIYSQVAGFQDHTYGFTTGAPYGELGLYYNAALVRSLGVANPTQMYLDGNWTWSSFESWATSVKAALPANQYVMGGAYSAWAEALVPLNGGRLVSLEAQRVGFALQPALGAYDYIFRLTDQKFFEPSPTFDSGSPDWQAGNVVIHPGRLWFVTAPDRWGQLPFAVEYVPYPISDSYKASGGTYLSPVSGVSVYTIASGLAEGKAELAFKVWNELQLWKSSEEGLQEFTEVLEARFNEENSITAFLDVYDKVYLDIMNALGIGAYEPNGWTVNIIDGIRNNTARTKMSEIVSAYTNALDDYLGKK